MLFVAVLLCDFYANCADIMQIVLFLCKLWGFYANSAVLMQIVLFWCKLSHLSQFTLFCRKWHFCRKIRALAGTFGSAIRRRLLLMMSAALAEQTFSRDLSMGQIHVRSCVHLHMLDERSGQLLAKWIVYRDDYLKQLFLSSSLLQLQRIKSQEDSKL